MIKPVSYTHLDVYKRQAYVNTPFVKILTGIRRCGKSTILKMLIDEMKEQGIRDEQILHYSFDSLEYEDIKTANEMCIRDRDSALHLEVLKQALSNYQELETEGFADLGTQALIRHYEGERGKE